MSNYVCTNHTTNDYQNTWTPIDGKELSSALQIQSGGKSYKMIYVSGVLVIVIFLQQKVFQHFFTSFQSFVHIYNISETQLEETALCLNTRTRPSFIVCIYDTGQDIFISKSLQSSGLWEPKMTKLFQQALRQTESVTVIDVGANVGYFSLYAAALGHHAVAIEPVNRNVQKLAQAIHINKFQPNIIILRNALSNERRRVHLSLPTATNQGSSKVLTDEELQYSTNTVTASSIVLDDLIPFINTNDVIIKLDVGMFTLYHIYRRLKWS